MIAIVTLALAVAATPVPGGTLAEHNAIRDAVTGKHGGNTQVTSILIVAPYALASGTAANAPVHDGLRGSKGNWQIVCQLGAGPASARTIESLCKFPPEVAVQLAADEGANAAASHGSFGTAVTIEENALKASSPGMRPSEAARLQYLTQLERQMELGQINRTQAITQWNSFRLATFLP